MKTSIIFIAFVTASLFLSAQTTKQTKAEKIKEVIKNLPEDLIKQPEVAADTNANKLVDDNLSIEIPPVWKEKGVQSIIEFKVLKTDKEPLVNTFPLPEKKIAQGLTISIKTMKKTTAEKKQMLIEQIKKHATAFYKDIEKDISKEELIAKANTMISTPEAFTTVQGKQGEIYYANDIESAQSNYIVLLVLPGLTGNIQLVQFTYFRYNYETGTPEDIMERRFFLYPEEQQVYVDFTKKIFKTFFIR